MARQVFRQAALDRLASPEKLDRPLSLVGVRGWLAFAVLAAAILSAVGWALVSHAPVKVQAQGIVLQQGRLVEIVADSTGRVDELRLRAGDKVNAGAPIAEFLRPDLSRELATSTAELTDAQERFKTLEEFYPNQDERETKAERQRLASIEDTRTLIARREELLADRIGKLSRLVKKKIILQTKLIDAELELSNARERLSRLSDEATQISQRTIDRRRKQELALLDERLKADGLERKVRRLTERLKERRFVRSSSAGRVVEVKVSKGDVVSPGTAIATLAPTDDGEQEALCVLYVTPADGKRIEPGMEVEIVPSTFRREEFGFIRGEVVFVSSVPVTADGMRSVLRNDQLVTQFSSGAAPFEVRVKFFQDQSTPSGLSWSSSRGPNAKVNAGTILQAAIEVERVPIANLVVPGLAKTLGIKGDG